MKTRHRRDHIISQDTKKSTDCLFMMVKESGKGNSVVGSETPHRCSLSCLGPLTFHPRVVGDMVRLSRGCCLAEKRENTFKNGLVFSSRPVKIRERIRLRVKKDVLNWHGALRVGFTTLAPSARSLPLPTMAIPNLTDTRGHWAAPVHESLCQAGSELEFWVSSRGTVYFKSNNIREHKLLKGVDLSQPLWAMIDIYGQTCSILLLGSEKKDLFWTRRSCPVPECLDNNRSLIPDVSSLLMSRARTVDEYINCPDMEEGGDSVMSCVVCMEEQAKITLPCGHQCLCNQCTSRIIQQFGTCPLCRHAIRAPSVEGIRTVSGQL
ncbi:E3 ubiquitin-protein ligase NEURL3-like [Plectropomus leopardus]|uniref:E3 ubiquitin-protein ligase NEURL3-like n=1 Tax=Plectropomus leopardus TaxID=160734 RepID=UPI001C4B4CEF|nr:E3 ubiquitin-protein ligase NEURL3-like [Plectropomus leopardus]